MFKFFLFLTCFSLWGAKLPASEQLKELNAIDQRIEELRSRLEANQIKEANEEVQGQGEMIAEWKDYGQNLKNIRRLREENRQIQSEIEQLGEYKAQKLRQQQPHVIGKEMV